MRPAKRAVIAYVRSRRPKFGMFNEVEWATDTSSEGAGTGGVERALLSPLTRPISISSGSGCSAAEDVLIKAAPFTQILKVSQRVSLGSLQYALERLRMYGLSALE
jgi:hypothetical protein